MSGQQGQPNYQHSPIFYTGVVEDNNDPLKLGRIKARLVGLHTENLTDYPTSALPWADPVMAPIGNISEISSFSVPEKGSWVICAFHDMKFQRPFYIGCLPRIEKSRPDYSIGFSDPSQTFPLSANIGRTSISKVATGETGVLSNKPSVKSGGSVAPISEPVSGYAPLYPHDKVIQTKAGHVIEIDDTPGNERIQIMHKSGSFMEFHPDGNIIVHSKGSDVYVVGDSDTNIYSGADTNVFAAGNANVECTSVMNIKSGGAMTIDCGAALLIKSAAAMTVQSAANIAMSAVTAITEGAPSIALTSAVGVMTLAGVGGTSSVTASGPMEIKSTSGTVDIKGTTINLN